MRLPHKTSAVLCLEFFDCVSCTCVCVYSRRYMYIHIIVHVYVATQFCHCKSSLHALFHMYMYICGLMAHYT